MKLPVRLPEHHPFQRWLAACLIALVCTLLGVLLSAPAKILAAVRLLDQVFYDSLYRLRPAESKQDGPIVIVAVDDASIEIIDKAKKFGWPWPREFWGHIAKYAESAGAKAVVIDLLFDRSSVHNQASDDDNVFAAMINEVKIPVILATYARPDGTLWEIAPPIAMKHVGASNVSRDDVVRSYEPVVYGHDSLAIAAIKKIGLTLPDWARRPFLLRYYGPHAVDDTPVTFRYVKSANVLAAALDPANAATKYDIRPEIFKDKIVVIAAITAGTYDLKVSPLSAKYPGVEVHATAMQNLIEAQRVAMVGPVGRVALMLGACLLAGIATLLPGRTWMKIMGSASGVVFVLWMTWALFAGKEITWLPPGAALIAALASGFVSLAYSYLTELRQRRFVLKALTQYVSKPVADELTRDPRKLSLGGQRREMTVMFTDLANFTALSETMDVERLAGMLNFYLQEMSEIILRQNGTLDKYIGDSIMSFWNAPLNQVDHARLACYAALEMQRREQLLQPQLRELAGGPVRSRTGINSGPMIFGNMGSSYKFDYTVLGDAVNLASRLEAANKIYGTKVLLSETTANYVKDRFVLRKVDLLRVKGRQQPMPVYELMAEGVFEPRMMELIAKYAKAFELYQARMFNEAWEMLIPMAQDYAEDGPTATLLGRVLQYRETPPPDDWDGVFTAKEK